MKRKVFAAFAAVAALSLGLGYAASKTAVKPKVSAATLSGAKAGLAASSVLTCDIGAPGPGGGTVFLENKNWQKDGWRYLEAYWSDDTIGVKYAESTKLVSAINAGKVGDLKSSKKSDWYIPSESELNSVISALGYPSGLLPPGRYFVDGGKKFVSFDFDVKTNKRTLNKLPARFSAITLRGMPARGLKGAALTRFQKGLDKRNKLEQKRQELNVGNIVVIRKITVAELSKGMPRFRFELGKRRTIRDIRQAVGQTTGTPTQQQATNEAVTEVTFISGDGSGSSENYSAIDNYVLGLNIPTSTSIADAARKICQTAKSDMEKARAIFAWIGYNITYDYDSLKLPNSNDQIEIGIYNGEKTYERRTGVCAGYSALFKLMADAVGLQAEALTGSSKATTSKYDDEIDGWHAWNSVKVGDRTILLDTTWGAAYSQSGSAAPMLKDNWFDCDPALFVLSHLPYKSAPDSDGNLFVRGNSPETRVLMPEQQGLSKPISPEIYRVTPRLDPALAKMGVDGSTAINFLKGHPKSWVPVSYSNIMAIAKNGGLQINRFELTNELVVGQKVKFNFGIADGTAVKAYFNGTKVAELQNQKDAEFNFEETGTFVLQFRSPDGTLWPLMTYNVVASRSAPQAQAMTAAFSSY